MLKLNKLVAKLEWSEHHQSWCSYFYKTEAEAKESVNIKHIAVMKELVKPSPTKFEKFAKEQEAQALKKWDLSKATPKEIEKIKEQAESERMESVRRYYELNERFPNSEPLEPMRINYYRDQGEPFHLFNTFPVNSKRFVAAPNQCAKMNNLFHNITYADDEIRQEFIESVPEYDCKALLLLLAKHRYIEKTALYNRALNSSKEGFIKNAAVQMIATIEWE
jgi:hypothetical protein